MAVEIAHNSNPHLTPVEHHHDDHGSGHHITPAIVYWKVFGGLMFLLAITVVAAFFDLTEILPIHIRGINILVMLAIAIIKATLVVLYFMEVKKGTKLTWVWAAAGFIWFPLMFAILGDYLTRNWITVLGW
ncbi:MAG: cytochrome C oxidase subunit IV family protein [Chthonomonadaceae bacterium]|nr:cytochrome C oxidase subunit IV family protein [Chthonomonadaceae bacterium]